MDLRILLACLLAAVHLSAVGSQQAAESIPASDTWDIEPATCPPKTRPPVHLNLLFPNRTGLRQMLGTDANGVPSGFVYDVFIAAASCLPYTLTFNVTSVGNASSPPNYNEIIMLAALTEIDDPSLYSSMLESGTVSVIAEEEPYTDILRATDCSLAPSVSPYEVNNYAFAFNNDSIAADFSIAILTLQDNGRIQPLYSKMVQSQCSTTAVSGQAIPPPPLGWAVVRVMVVTYLFVAIATTMVYGILHIRNLIPTLEEGLL